MGGVRRCARYPTMSITRPRLSQTTPLLLGKVDLLLFLLSLLFLPSLFFLLPVLFLLSLFFSLLLGRMAPPSNTSCLDAASRNASDSCAEDASQEGGPAIAVESSLAVADASCRWQPPFSQKEKCLQSRAALHRAWHASTPASTVLSRPGIFSGSYLVPRSQQATCKRRLHDCAASSTARTRAAKVESCGLELGQHRMA